MDVAMGALAEAYEQLAAGDAVCRPRIDISIPTKDPQKTYRWGSMEGGSTSGYFAIRMKSDIIYQVERQGRRTEEKYCLRPGKFCGLVLLFDIQNGEPLAILNDGILQHMRVGADSGLGVKYMARENARVVGMIGSGGMARAHLEAFLLVRDIERVQVYSPTRANREAYAKDMAEKFDVEAAPVATPEAAQQNADIVAGCTDSVDPVIFGEWLAKGSHITCIGGKLDAEAVKRIDLSLRFGNSPAPDGLSEFGCADEHLTYTATPKNRKHHSPKRGRGAIAGDRAFLLKDFLEDRTKGRSSPDQITFSERGSIQGAQFYAVAGKVYELAKAKGIGSEFSTDLLLQDIRN